MMFVISTKLDHDVSEVH